MLGQKLGRSVQSYKNLVYTIEGTVLIQSLRNFIRMLMIIISRSNLKLVYTLKGTVLIKKIHETLSDC